LDDAAETEDGEEDDAIEQPLATGLHAKVYLFETRYYSDYTHVVMGSANATNAALNASKNIEILVGLVGRKNKVGGIDELLGADGLGEYLVDLTRPKRQRLMLLSRRLRSLLRRLAPCYLKWLCPSIVTLFERRSVGFANDWRNSIP